MMWSDDLWRFAMLYLPWQNWNTCKSNLNTCTPCWHPWSDNLQLSHISNPQYSFPQALQPQTLPGESYMGSSSLWAPFQGFAILKGSQIAKLILWDIFEFFIGSFLTSLQIPHAFTYPGSHSQKPHSQWVCSGQPYSHSFLKWFVCSLYDPCVHTHSCNRRSCKGFSFNILLNVQDSFVIANRCDAFHDTW